ncbi:hypothetical protein POM88_014572 [Heracleum sosnowskyi]|uniref:Uncharacterized protein n=1 Tax=Heracleum sosnowskyi TaxID=360622 RepID=A0AAD8J3C6_9APIA|nr:hypothetical protein POM88_014572 [Heracleum sosnowskyi]
MNYRKGSPLAFIRKELREGNLQNLAGDLIGLLLLMQRESSLCRRNHHPELLRKVGNVYVQFRVAEHALNALKNLTGRYYDGTEAGIVVAEVLTGTEAMMIALMDGAGVQGKESVGVLLEKEHGKRSGRTSESYSCC